MEFEDMQRIWNKQQNESLYAINEDALRKRIHRKSRSTDQALNMLEGGVIGSSIFSLISLYINWVGDGLPLAYFLLPLMLIVISLYVFVWRRQRQKELQKFDSTTIGKLDKAIAQNDFLVERIQKMIWWYMVPVFGGFAIYFYFEQGPYWRESMVAMIVLGILSYIGVHWELNKFHIPKKRDLEALRDLLSQPL